MPDPGHKKIDEPRGPEEKKQNFYKKHPKKTPIANKKINLNRNSLNN